MQRLPPNTLRIIGRYSQAENLASLASTSRNMSSALQPNVRHRLGIHMDIFQAAHAGNLKWFKGLVRRLNFGNPVHLTELFRSLKSWIVYHDTENALKFVIQEFPNAYDEDLYADLLNWALEYDRLKPFMYLLETFPNLEHQFPWLLYALELSKINIAKAIIKRYPDQVRKGDVTQQTPFHYAYVLPKTSIDRMLEIHPEGFNQVDVHGRTVLHTMSEHADVPMNIVSYILSKMTKNKRIMRNAGGRRAINIAKHKRAIIFPELSSRNRPVHELAAVANIYAKMGDRMRAFANADPELLNAFTTNNANFMIRQLKRTKPEEERYLLHQMHKHRVPPNVGRILMKHLGRTKLSYPKTQPTGSRKRTRNNGTNTGTAAKRRRIAN